MPKILLKTTRFHNEYQNFFRTFYIFTKIWDLEIFDNEITKQRPSKSGWFWEAQKRKKFEFSKLFKYHWRYFDCERLWCSKLSLLKLPTVKLAISFKQSLLSPRSEIFVKKYEIMRTFNIRYESGRRFHKILGKSSYKSSKWRNEKLKTSVLDGLLHQIQKFSKLHLCYGRNSLAEITHFNINAGLKFPRLGRNLQRKCVSVQFSNNF